MAVFDELLSIKRFRESQAELAVARERSSVLEAEQFREGCGQALQDFRHWAAQREDELYGDLCSRVVQVREIENVLQDVAGLRDGERQHEQRLLEADEKLEQAHQALDEQRMRHREATRHTEKFVELARIHFDEHFKAVQDQEDREMEEVALQIRDRDDWQEHEVYEQDYSGEY